MKSPDICFISGITGVYLRLDTKDGSIISNVPSKPKTNRILNSQPLAKDNKAGRFQLYPTDNICDWLLFDSTTGDFGLLKWSDKKDILIKCANLKSDFKFACFLFIALLYPNQRKKTSFASRWHKDEKDGSDKA